MKARIKFTASTMIQDLWRRIVSWKTLRHGPTSACLDESAVIFLLESTATTDDRRGLLEHLAQCPDCREQVAAICELRFAEDSPAGIPPGLLARARGLVASEERGPGFPVLRWGAIAAATASIVLVTTFVYRRPDVPAPFLPPGAVNPALTLMANALRGGDHLIERMQ